MKSVTKSNSKNITEHLELVKVQGSDFPVWRCPCGNLSTGEGFLGITSDDQLSEPLPDDLDAAFICLACGRVGLEVTGEIVRTVDPVALNPEIKKVLATALLTA